MEKVAQQVHLRLPADLHEQMAAAAKFYGESIGTWIRDAIRQRLERES